MGFLFCCSQWVLFVLHHHFFEFVSFELLQSNSLINISVFILVRLFFDVHVLQHLRFLLGLQITFDVVALFGFESLGTFLFHFDVLFEVAIERIVWVIRFLQGHTRILYVVLLAHLIYFYPYN